MEAFTAKVEGWRTTGLRLVARGQAACVLISGGTAPLATASAASSNSSGTAESAAAPAAAVKPAGEQLRAAADVGLPSAKPLLALWAEKLARLQWLSAERHGGLQHALPWYIVAPAAAEAGIKALLTDNKYFGLSSGQVRMKEQPARQRGPRVWWLLAAPGLGRVMARGFRGKAAYVSNACMHACTSGGIV